MITFVDRISFSWSSINALVCGLAVDVWFSYPRYENLYKLVSWPFHSLLLLNWCCLLPLVLFLHWVSIFFVRTQYYPSFCYVRNKQVYGRFAAFLPVRLDAATGADTKLYKFPIWLLIQLIMFILGFLFKYCWFVDKSSVFIYLHKPAFQLASTYEK